MRSTSTRPNIVPAGQVQVVVRHGPPVERLLGQLRIGEAVEYREELFAGLTVDL